MHPSVCNPDDNAVPLQAAGKMATHRGQWDVGALNMTVAHPS